MQLVVFGVGCVGLVTGTGLAELGHDVVCVDVDNERIGKLRDGVVPIHEPGLQDLVRRNERAGRLRFASRLDATHAQADVYVVAVGAPLLENGTTDLRAVKNVVEVIACEALQDAVVVVKTTVPVGTCDALQERIDASVGVKLEVVSCPEFLKEGTAVDDFFRPDRVVIGARDERALATVRSLYAPMQLSGQRIVETDRRSAELAKYAANTLLAMRVSFMNEMAQLCAATGGDVHAVRLAVGSDTRIGRRFLYAGPGYGGSCLPKDVQALAALGREHHVPMRLAEATHAANRGQRAFLVRLVDEAVGGLDGKTVALWGLSFKPETDDVRDAASVDLTRALLERGSRVVGHDPVAGSAFLRAIGGASGSRVRVVANEYDAIDGADALVLLTEWRSYLGVRFHVVRDRLRRSTLGPVVIDARNVWSAPDARRAGLRYVGIGVGGHYDASATPIAKGRA